MLILAHKKEVVIKLKKEKNRNQWNNKINNLKLCFCSLSIYFFTYLSTSMCVLNARNYATAAWGDCISLGTLTISPWNWSSVGEP